MAFPQRQAAIVGVYTTKQGRKLTQSSFELEMEAIKGAIADAGLEMSDIDGVIPMNATPHVGRVSAHQFWAEQLGERPLTLLEIGLTSGAVAKAAVAIAAGMAEVVVLFWGKSGWELGPGGTPVPDRAPRTDPWSFEIFGGGYAHMYALWAQRYMHEFGVTNDQLAQVAVTHRYHATLNPDSVMGERGEITVGGKMPCNTDGGLLSNSHCGHPAGLHTIEVVRQLRGEAGERQIPDPKIGLSLAQGVSVHGQAGTLIMAVD